MNVSIDAAVLSTFSLLTIEILCHDVGSKELEEFDAGLGWEGNLRDLHGFVPTMPTLQIHR